MTGLVAVGIPKAVRIVAVTQGMRRLSVAGVLAALVAGISSAPSAVAQPATGARTPQAPPMPRHEAVRAPASRPEPARAAWQRPERWARLRVGMSQLEVLRLLGEPGKITRYYAFDRWEYPDALGRRVDFDARGRLMLWGPLAR